MKTRFANKIVLTGVCLLMAVQAMGDDRSVVILVNADDYCNCWGDDFDEIMQELDEPLTAAAYALAFRFNDSTGPAYETTFSDAVTWMGETGYDGVLDVAVGSNGMIGISYYGEGAEACSTFEDIAQIDPTESLTVEVCTNSLDPQVYGVMLSSVDTEHHYTGWKIVEPLFSAVLRVDTDSITSCWCNSFYDSLEMLEDPLAAGAYALAAVSAECATASYEEITTQFVDYLEDADYQGRLDLVVDADGLVGIAFYGSGPSTNTTILNGFGQDPDDSGSLLSYGEGTLSDPNAAVVLRSGLRETYEFSETKNLLQPRSNDISKSISLYAVLRLEYDTQHCELGNSFNMTGYTEPFSCGMHAIFNCATCELSADQPQDRYEAMNLEYDHMVNWITNAGYKGDLSLICGSQAGYLGLCYSGWVGHGDQTSCYGAFSFCTSINNFFSDNGYFVIECGCEKGTLEAPMANDHALEVLSTIAQLDGNADLMRWDWINPD